MGEASFNNIYDKPPIESSPSLILNLFLNLGILRFLRILKMGEVSKIYIYDKSQIESSPSLILNGRSIILLKNMIYPKLKVLPFLF
jgi:hypothetical protein